MIEDKSHLSSKTYLYSVKKIHINIFYSHTKMLSFIKFHFKKLKLPLFATKHRAKP